MSTQNGYSLATFLIETESRNTQVDSKKKTWQGWPAMAPHTIDLPCALALPPPAIETPPRSVPAGPTQEGLMFSNLTPSESQLSPAATKSDNMLLAFTPPFHCASILQPSTPRQVFAFKSWTISAPVCLNRFTLAE